MDVVVFDVVGIARPAGVADDIAGFDRVSDLEGASQPVVVGDGLASAEVGVLDCDLLAVDGACDPDFVSVGPFVVIARNIVDYFRYRSFDCRKDGRAERRGKVDP